MQQVDQEGAITLPARMLAVRPNDRASQLRSPSATATAGRSTATVVPGWAAPHSAPRRSISAFCTGYPAPGFGRTAASSVSGTGLPGQAP